MKTNVTKLFVYGSLRSGFHNPAYDYISKYFTLIGEAKVKGKLYDMGNYPAAVQVFDDHFIVGELYDLKETQDFSWAIEQLDDYEGVNPEEGEKALYKRELVNVLYKEQSVEAWIYWYAGDIEGQPIIPSGDVKDFILHKSKL